MSKQGLPKEQDWWITQSGVAQMPVSEEKPCFVGIDVSKKTLDICILPQQERFQVENKSFKSLCKRLKAFSPTLIVMETTGGYEQAVYEALSQAGFRVSRENAVNLYHHRRSRGKWAKTDGIDAETIAHYAQCHTDSIRDKEPLDKTQDSLRQLLYRRADLVKTQTAEKNRLQALATHQTPQNLETLFYRVTLSPDPKNH